VVRLLEDDLAEVDTGGGREEVSVALVDVRVGDTVLVHAKEAIAVDRITVSSTVDRGRG
jgi:hydrogenase expression/formation protein HypC